MNSDDGRWAALRRAAREDQDFFIELVTNPRDAVRDRPDFDFSEREVERIAERVADIVGDGSDYRPTLDDLRTMWDLRDRLRSEWGGPWMFRGW